MVIDSLSLDVINANSEYIVRKDDKEGTLSFVTDSSAEIFISFEKDDILQSGWVYQFGISNPKGRNRHATARYAIRYWRLSKNSLRRTRLRFYISVKLVMVCSRCVAVCSSIGSAYIRRRMNISFCHKLYMMRKIMRIIQH